ncbi:MAG: LacI family transcriptional regulator [Lentisphaeria bacterium]|nr:LacI family transcriptional regulator [Lentisphaeria bacterium]
MRVTLKDVAAKAGVSCATVSICLNHHPVSRQIPEETRRRISRVVAELGYRPSAFARALSTGYSNLIGIDIREIFNSYFSHLAGFAIEEAAGYDFNVIVTQECGRSRCGSVLSGNMLDGMICCSGPPGRKPAKPCVLIDSERRGFNCVLHDISGAMKAAAEVMKQRGHKKICGIFDRAVSKAVKFTAEFREAGLVPELSGLPTSSRDDRLATVVQILKERPAALVINGHLTTRDLLRKLAAADNHYHPDIIPVCGFWNGELTDPHLPGVVVTDVRGIAVSAVRMLVENIRNHDIPPRIEFIPAKFYRNCELNSIPLTDPENEY